MPFLEFLTPLYAALGALAMGGLAVLAVARLNRPRFRPADRLRLRDAATRGQAARDRRAADVADVIDLSSVRATRSEAAR